MGIFKKKELPVPFMEDGLFGYKDKKGNVIIPPQFNMAYPFNNKTRTASVMVERGGDYVFIDESGDFTHGETYKWVVTDKGKTVVTNHDNPHVINPEDGSVDGLSSMDYALDKK